MHSMASNIKISQDKESMLRRALERIIQLYTDKSHFVYELLQNAEDAEAKCVKFVQYPDRLEFLHDGKPFTIENLQGLCDIGKSDKVTNLNQIGEFGVGFKSVFGICEKVSLYSDPANFRSPDIGPAVPFAVEILDFINPIDIEQEKIERAYTTKFVFPYAVGQSFSGFKTIDDLKDILSKKLQNLGITTLLFMKSLELIEYQIFLEGEPIEGQYLLDKTVINDHCLLACALGTSNTAISPEERTEEISYLKFSRAIEKEGRRTVDIAFPVHISSNGEYICQAPKNPYISVYFPTETESKLGFIVQGPYRTTPNRSSIPADDSDNVCLANETATLLHQSLLELRDTKKLNMSFIKALPLSEKNFDNFALFRPLYDTVKALLTCESIIPCKHDGYVTASCAKIARQERLANLFTDELLSDLFHNGNKYSWLPTYLTETNKEYETVYKYLTSTLKIDVIRPEDLRSHFALNPTFLCKQNDDWIVELYSILENIGAAFSKARNESNMLTADIVKTSAGKFVAAYRKTESRQYIPNVFLPSKKIQNPDVHFVDEKIYSRCQHFFDEILQVQKPNEYEFFIKDIKKRYASQCVFNEETHIDDLRHLIKYLKNEDYREEILNIIRDDFSLRCSDGILRNTHVVRVFVPISNTGIDIENYLKNIANNVYFVDVAFYSNYGIDIDMLCQLGVQESLLCNESTITGIYSTGTGGRRPEWWTVGDFRWKLTIEFLKEAIQYISKHPTANDAIIKSKTIVSILLENESKLKGIVNIGGSTPNLENEPCDLVKILKGERTRDWNGKWLYTESWELVSPRDISKYDLSVSLYGKMKIDSVIFELLGFRKTESDEVDSLKKTIPQKQLDAYFENELRLRFGLSVEALAARVLECDTIDYESTTDTVKYPFPTARVRNIESLKKHAAEMLCFADPVNYAYAVRKIRVSNRDKEVRAYLLNMYRYDGLYKYACQMCHDSCSNIEKAQIFNDPKTELDPMNICLCPNCHTVYRQIRNNTPAMDCFKRQILELSESVITNDEYVTIAIENYELWFTQVHIAEIQALLQLEIAVSSNATAPKVSSEDGDQTGLSVYSSYKGKTLKRKDGFLGKVIDVNTEYLLIRILSGEKAGTETKIQLSFISKNPSTYEVLCEATT